ncbi:response regulator transcription factor [Metabacillus sp. GX 13764]|uniref:response regulator transcription factor n=1 Tax=Metabacillus kandeliae TaxID=2900151 RepID=UPI001E3A85AA|nr:response regulator transcription factor [Metabacillus kandeliae]MCD7035362.1 response regulator transcription factor [Metabacillus kandeliae]
MIHILVADDDPHIRELLRHTLQTEGYLVSEAADGNEAATLLSQQVHLAVVDVMMPNKDGYQLCEEIRSSYNFPVILLTAKDQLSDKEKGYLVGTDDYVTKPFEPKELLFRIKALLRRYKMASLDKIVLNGTTIDRRSYEVHSNGKILLLPMKEFELLAQLASFPKRVFSRDELIQLVWGADFTGDDRTIDVHIKRLRERFASVEDFHIQTVRGIGYKLEALKQ